MEVKKWAGGTGPISSAQDLPGEVWKDVPGHEGFYMVSNLGRVKSLPRDISREGVYPKQEFFLKPKRKHTTDAGVYFAYGLQADQCFYSATITAEQMSAPETWAEIEGTGGRYQASSRGRVKSLGGSVPMKNYTIKTKGKIMTNQISKWGYPMVHLKRPGAAALLNIHRLVALAFIPNPEGKPQVNHINRIKADNRVENLEWVSARENALHAIKNGRNKRRAFSMPVYQYSTTGEFINRFESARAAARALGIKHRENIRSCADGVLKTAYGFVWSYEQKQGTA